MQQPKQFVLFYYTDYELSNVHILSMRFLKKNTIICGLYHETMKYEFRVEKHLWSRYLIIIYNVSAKKKYYFSLMKRYTVNNTV